MVGTFTLKAIFGDPNVNLAEKETVMIYVKGVQKLMPFSLAFKTVWQQTFDVERSFVRLWLFDPLTDWSLSPGERAMRHNQTVIKNYLREKLEMHAEWRKKNQIKGPGEIIYFADLLMADKDRFTEEQALDEIISLIYTLGQITASASAQLCYQLIKGVKAQKKVLTELRKVQLKNQPKSQGNQGNQDSEEEKN